MERKSSSNRPHYRNQDSIASDGDDENGYVAGSSHSLPIGKSKPKTGSGKPKQLLFWQR